MHTRMKCIIADDERIARKGLEKYIKDIPFLDLVASCCNAMEVQEVMRQTPIDLLLLDIQMPGTSGIELLRNTAVKPITIITTAFPDYALVSYELDVLDYLVKPIPFDRFFKAISKAKEFFELKHKDIATDNKSFFFIKCDKKYEKINFDELLYVEGLQNYVALHTINKKIISYLTIKNVEESLPSSKFIKINKSNIISLEKVDSVSGNVVYIGSNAFSISRHNRLEILDRIFANTLIRRK